MVYQVIDLSLTPFDIGEEPQVTEDFFQTLVGEKRIEAIELRGVGKNMLADLRLFLFLRRKATEIVYREKEAESGLLIFSIHDVDQVIRPHWVKGIMSLTEKEEEALRKERNAPFLIDEAMDIALLWKRAQETATHNPYSALVFLLAEIIKGDGKIGLVGTLPIEVAFFVVNYLVATKHEVEWNGIMLT